MNTLCNNDSINNEQPPVINLINQRSFLCPSKCNKVESIMIYSLDNQHKQNKKPSLIVCRSDITTYEYSLNRLFEVAKEEHSKRQNNCVRQK